MLQIKNIRKQYKTGDLIQQALDDVSLNFRDNEFVAILGPSGSGKTTLLNVIGGLDRYDSGDLIINSISTKKYKDRDWDSYRNHTIGFVFQSYNLISHQSVLANVELALTISGISRKERKLRAVDALNKVGLGDQLHKKPNQMSGGQMQRVAIARALVNNPDILLADEPTGALDTDTSVQVMELLKEVAKDRLVIMVTHNPELAENYANRIVSLRDGKIQNDTNPFNIEETATEPEHKNMGKSSMSLMTALSLSFNNLRTKKGRTILTAFAGSIGIIGISLILSLSSGVNNYITDIQKDTMGSYPITIDAQSIDLSSLMTMSGSESVQGSLGELNHDLNQVYSNGRNLEAASKITTSITENNLTEFKKYLDDTSSEIHNYVGENGIVYTYDTAFDTYVYDADDKLINTKSASETQSSAAASAEGTMMSEAASTEMPSESAMSSMMSNMAISGGGRNNLFGALVPNKEGLVSSVVTDNYDLVYGSWPENADQVVLVMNEHNEISISDLAALGLISSKEYDEMLSKIQDGDDDFKADVYNWSYEDICKQPIYLVPACNYYEENDRGTFDYMGNDQDYVDGLIDDAIELKISGIIRPQADNDSATFTSTVGYTNAFVEKIIKISDESPVVKAQLDTPDTNVLTGMVFEPDDDETKIENTKEYINSLGVTDKSNFWKKVISAAYADDPETLQAISNLDESQMAQMLEQYMEDPDDEVLISIYDAEISAGSYDDNMTAFGYVSLDAPSSISIYADSFEDKDFIASSIENYNKTVSDENQISYTDFVALLMSSVTTIINVISYVLIAFVAVSLVVSSIMIGIITYISVLERTKEIGILRAIGASKRNISQVFNAETFIVGLFAGLIGVGLSCLLLIPTNSIIHAVAGTSDVSASLPITAAIILIVLSVLLTLIGGIIPSKKAAKKDPVTALRSE